MHHSQHISRLTDHDLLTQAEERQLAGLIADPTTDPATRKAATERLILSNTRLVVSVAAKLVRSGVPLDDLIQEGVIGLMTAARKFDPAMGYRFTTYAVPWIKQSIQRAVASQGRTIRLPIYKFDEVKKVLGIIQDMTKRNDGRRPTDEAIAIAVDMPLKRLRAILEATRVPISLNETLGEGDDAEFGDFVPDGDSGPEAVTLDARLAEMLADLLDSLSPREAKIVRLRYGLGGCRSHTLQEVGEMFGVTRERIRQVEMQALRRLRHPSRSRRLRGAL